MGLSLGAGNPTICGSLIVAYIVRFVVLCCLHCSVWGFLTNQDGFSLSRSLGDELTDKFRGQVPWQKSLQGLGSLTEALQPIPGG